MKIPRYLSLVMLFIAFLFVSLAYGQYNNTDNSNTDNNRNRSRNKQNDQVNQDQQRRNNSKDNQGKADYTKEHRYSYRGQYRNFDNYNHRDRFYYDGKYYPFSEYNHYYSREGNNYTYEGTYEGNDNIFIFTDKYGNEFDVYLAPVDRSSRRFRGRPLQLGDTYRINMRSTKVYPRSSGLHLGANLSFGWGNLSLNSGRYYEMFSSPQLVNIRGQIYLR